MADKKAPSPAAGGTSETIEEKNKGQEVLPEATSPNDVGTPARSSTKSNKPVVPPVPINSMISSHGEAAVSQQAVSLEKPSLREDLNPQGSSTREKPGASQISSAAFSDLPKSERSSTQEKPVINAASQRSSVKSQVEERNGSPLPGTSARSSTKSETHGRWPVRSPSRTQARGDSGDDLTINELVAEGGADDMSLFWGDDRTATSPGGPRSPSSPSSPPRAAVAIDVNVARFGNFLRQMRGAVLRAWRMDLDMKGTGNVLHSDFTVFCRRRQFPVWVTKAIWNALRPDGCGLPIELFEVAPWEASNADALAQVLMNKCNGPPTISAWWALLNPIGNGHLTQEEFKQACAKLGFQGNPTMIFRGLDTSGAGRLWKEEFAYLFKVSRHAMQQNVLMKAATAQQFGEWVRCTVGGFDVLLARMNLVQRDKNVGVLDCVSLLHQMGWKGDAHALALKAGKLHDCPGRVSAEVLYSLAKNSGLDGIGSLDLAASPASTTFSSPPQSPGGSNRKVGKVKGVIKVRFSPGRLGLVIDYEDFGRIREVLPGSQAECAGVQPGMFIYKIDGEPYMTTHGNSKTKLQNYIEGLENYVVSFRKTPLRLASRLDPVDPEQRQKHKEVEEAVAAVIQDKGYETWDWAELQAEVRTLVDTGVISAAKSTTLLQRPRADVIELADDLNNELATRTRHALREFIWKSEIWTPCSHNTSTGSACRQYFSFPVANTLRRPENTSKQQNEMFPGCEDRPALQDIKSRLEILRSKKEAREAQRRKALWDAGIDPDQNVKKVHVKSKKQKVKAAPTEEEIEARNECIRKIQSMLASALRNTSADKLVKKFDKTDKGALQKDDFKKLMRLELRVPEKQITDEDLFSVFAEMDGNIDGAIDEKELTAFLEKDYSKKKKRKEVTKELAKRFHTWLKQATGEYTSKELFDEFDEQGEETLDIQCFTNLVRIQLKVASSALPNADIEAFVCALSATGDECITFAEFNEFISKGFDALYKTPPPEEGN